RRTVEALGVDARLEVSRVERSGISAVKVDVIAAGEKELPREAFWEQQAAHAHEHQALGHEHTHAHGHEHADDHAHSHSGDSQHAHAHALEHEHGDQQGHGREHHHDQHRGLKEIRAIINKADISAGAKAQAIRIFEALGAAEAKVHNTAIENIHFHEVGAI